MWLSLLRYLRWLHTDHYCNESGLYSRLYSFSRRLVFRYRVLVRGSKMSSGVGPPTAWTTARRYSRPGMPSGGHAHASLGRRAKEEAALSAGRPEDTLCIVRVVVACDHSRVFLHVASHRAICLRLAR